MQMRLRLSVRHMQMKSVPPEGGEGLDGLMLERRRHLRGIVNGIDLKSLIL